MSLCVCGHSVEEHDDSGCQHTMDSGYSCPCESFQPEIEGER